MEEESPGFMEKLVERAQKAAGDTMPKCEICGGTLMGGSLTIYHSGRSMIICMKCTLDSVEYWLTRRDERMHAKE